MARTTVYTITNRRVVMRVGVVLSITFNLPFAQIASAGFRARGKAGDIVLSLAGSDRIAYLHLWPHVRPWQLKRTQPMLRALADAKTVAQTLATALAAGRGGPLGPAACGRSAWSIRAADCRPWSPSPWPTRPDQGDTP